MPDQVFVTLRVSGETVNDSKTYCMSTAGGEVVSNIDDKLIVRNLPAPSSCSP